jgi:glycosyltransferase involved in cell wall biosynthesis
MAEMSIVIPAYNAEKTIGQTLAALERLDFERHRFEVLVVDDGSTDATPKILSAFARRTNLDFQVIHKDRGRDFGPGVARNLGVRAARGSIIAFTDADCVPDLDWLRVIHRVIREDGRVLIGGEVYCDQMVVFPHRMAPVGLRMVSANLAVDVARVGREPLVTSFRGYVDNDRDLVLRLEQLGYPYVHIYEMRVLHPVVAWSLGMVARRGIGFRNNVKLFKQYGKHNTFNPLLRPRIFGRISLVSAVFFLVPCMLVLSWWGGRGRFVAFSLLILAIGFIAIVLRFLTVSWRGWVRYSPPNASELTLRTRLWMLVNVIVYLLSFVVGRIVGSVENRYLLL